MASDTKIEWATKVWNPVRGCSRVSEGCRNCYAERQAMRFSGPGQPYEGLVAIANGHPQWTGKIRTVPEALAEPLRWHKPQRIFVNSMSDLFHESVPLAFIAQMFNVMTSVTPDCGKRHKHEEECWMGEPHQFPILTKRPERMRSIMAKELSEYAGDYMPGDDCLPLAFEFGWPPKNVWLGVSVEDQTTADERIPILLETPAAVRWVSYEPALGPISFRWAKWQQWKRYPGAVNGEYDGFKRLDWVVAGGESGPGARPAHPDWFRRVRDECHAAGVPFFFKQWGEYLHIDDPAARKGKFREAVCGLQQWPAVRVGKKHAGRQLDGREHNEFPRGH